MADYQTIRTAGTTRTVGIDEGLRAHMNKVYGTMSVGMVITALAAWAISQMAVDANGQLSALGVALYTSPLKWVAMLLPFGMVLFFGAAMNRLSAAGTQLFFYVYAAAMGVSLSSIFLVYTGFSIVQMFLITAIAFASLSIWGYTTKRDISGWGSFLIMGLVGIIVASLINMFVQSSAIMFAVSVIGVLVFAGLTAYDTQKIKTTYLAHAHHGDSEWLGKAAVAGALELYLDFINLFLMLLRLFGNRE